MLTTVFFDLDGTLTDSCGGIFAGVAHAMTALGHPTKACDVSRAWIGPPLYDCFRSIYGFDDATAREGVRLYREYYGREGLFVNEVYGGVVEMLDRLQAAGLRLCLATGKPHEYARRIVAHFGLDAALAAVYGAEFDGTRGDKAELLAYALEREGLSPAECAMVGDRRYDIEGALAVGLTPVGALWGYGSREELLTAGCPAAALAKTPAEVADYLLP